MIALSHITKDGERWDAIAHRYYGDVTKMALLIQENPNVPITEVLTGGQTLVIPIIDSAAAEYKDLPPWKR